MRNAKNQALLKTVSFFMALVIFVNVLSASAFSGVSAEGLDLFYDTYEDYISDFSFELSDSAELERMYIEQLFHGGVSVYKDYGRTALDGERLNIYEFLRGEIEKVAAGDITETVFTYTFPDTYTDKEVFDTDIREILNFLLADLPQSFYWFDKETGVQRLTRYTSADKKKLLNCTLSFTVSRDYAAENEQFKVNPAKINSAKAAAELAQSIAYKYADKSDYEKIVGYKEEICALTEYNHDAVDKTIKTPYGDPWQMVYVFDGDPLTNVVCEGYSKAFQLLCDLGDIECYTVTGTMAGGTGAGGHMWNIVVLNGKSYLVDITNCDDGTAGAPDLLLLKGAVQSSAKGCVFNCGGQTLRYEYDENAAIYSDEILTVSSEDFDPNVYLEHRHEVCTGAESCPDDIHGGHENRLWEKWTSTDSLPSSPGYYYLDNDVTLDKSRTLPSGAISICLSGHSITADKSVINEDNPSAASLITVNENTVFNMCDCQGGGKVYGNYTDACGGGVSNSGIFNMYSVSISENSANINALNTSYGGGVYNRNGEFNMYGGEISGNSAEYGGGICSSGPDSAFNMYGGKITENTVSGEGGGVYYNEYNKQISVGGSAVIEDNRANGSPNNFYILENKPILIDQVNPPAENFRICVTAEAEPTEDTAVNITGENGTDYSRYFRSDNPKYEIDSSENNEVRLILPHKHYFFHIEAVAPTCTEKGNDEYYVCFNEGGHGCLKIFDASKTNILDDIPELDALGHLYGEWTITVTPTEEPHSTGEAKRVCERDGKHEETVELKTLVDEMWKKTEDIPSTCFEEGKRVYTNEYGTVTVILKKLSHEYDNEKWQSDGEKHWQKCKNCGTVIEHTENPHSSWIEEITIEPTAEHEGIKTFTCGVCGYTKTETIPKPEIPPETSPSETEPPVTPPSETEPPVTPPSETEPPVTPPSETEPPVTPPSETEPPVTPPSETKPPVTPPSETELPVTPPSETEPPVTPPSETEPPVTPPSETEPPVTPPSETEPPVTPPSETEPIVTPPSESTLPTDTSPSIDMNLGSHFYIPETTVTEPIISVTDNTTVPPISSVEEITVPIPENTSGSIAKRVESADYAVEMPDIVSVLANNVSLQQEISNGSTIEILLKVDKISTVSHADGAAIREVLNGFKMWQYLDINLYTVINEAQYKINSTNTPITIKIVIPEALRKSGREYAMVRVHEGVGDILNDIDVKDDTITFATDKFSVYALVYKDKEVPEHNKPDADEPMNTGVASYTAVFLVSGITALSAAMTFTFIGTGTAGMSEERKNKIYDKLIRWGKDGGKVRRTTALALIFLLLSCYYGISNSDVKP